MKIFFRTFKFVLQILGKNERKSMFIVGILLLASSMLELFGLGVLIPVLTVALEPDSINKNQWVKFIYDICNFTSPKQLLIFLAVFLFVVVTLKNLLVLTITKYFSNYAFKLGRLFSLKVLDEYRTNGFLFFKSNDSNALIRNMKVAPYSFSNFQVLGVLNVANELLILSIIILFVLITNFFVFFVLSITVFPLFYVFYNYVRKKGVELGKKKNILDPLIYKRFFQVVNGYVDFLIAGTENVHKEVISNDLKQSVDIEVESTVFNLAPSKVIESSLMFAITCVVLYGVFFLESQSELVSILLILAIAGYRIAPSVNRIMISLNSMNQSIWVFDVLKNIENKKIEYKLIDNKLSFKNHLELNNICFRYNSSEFDILNEINVIISKGDIVGITGESGSGKTTLMNIILGFLSPTKGNYLIDGVEVTNYNVHSLYPKIGYVQQDVYLLDSSIAENIAFGYEPEKINRKKLVNVINRASLTEFVNSLPNGLDEKLNENGTNISGGQRQRIGIARALYNNPEILIFDEATASLDDTTAFQITDSIKNIADGNITIFIIAHRKDALRICNKFIKL
jgi:ABC-type multidrug transport system fused ATPase/permease subunit